MKLETLYRLIDNDEKLIDALRYLHDYFDVYGNGADFSNLLSKYHDVKDNESKRRFRERLKIFLFSHESKNDIIKFCHALMQDDSMSITENSFNHYELLCELNFEHQFNYFTNILENNPCSCFSFVIKASEASFGQRWLYNRLINSHPNKHEPIVFDFEALQYGHHQFIDDLLVTLGVVRNLSTLNLEDKKKKLRRGLERKLDTKTQFIVLKNAYSLLHSDQSSYICELIEYLHDELYCDDNHQCIFLMIENIPKPYKSLSVIKSNEVSEAKARLQRKQYYDLDNNSYITKEDILKWLNRTGSFATMFEDLIMDNCKIEDFINNECNGGHPEKVLELLSQKIAQKSFKEWLKH